MKLQELLTEGTWAAPQTVERAKELAIQMQRIIPAKEADQTIYHLVGDDMLFDDIADVEQEDGDQDVRPLIASKLKQWLQEGQRTGFAQWKEPWDPEALDILQQIVARFE